MDEILEKEAENKKSREQKNKEEEKGFRINVTKEEFEQSFREGAFYNKQTQDQEHLRSILEFVNVAPDMKILDLGCGTGYLSFPLACANANATVVGLDIVTETLKDNEQRAKEQGITNLSFVSYDGMTFPFEDQTFDLIVSRYALHHFPDIEYSLKEISRVLKKNGRFFLSDPRPNEDDETRFVDDYMQLKKDGHIKFYTRDEWMQL
ncbi:MAG: class I SAM-dependent methyltransferase [Lachnospiraceae bacterium]|nr:class I SAM-dependent methyltransferase [Lachnospiraceae bacterium]